MNKLVEYIKDFEEGTRIIRNISGKWAILVDETNIDALNDYLLRNNHKYPSYDKNWRVLQKHITGDIYFRSEANNYASGWGGKDSEQGVKDRGYRVLTNDELFERTELPEKWFIDVTKYNELILNSYIHLYNTSKYPNYHKSWIVRVYDPDPNTFISESHSSVIGWGTLQSDKELIDAGYVKITDQDLKLLKL